MNCDDSADFALNFYDVSLVVAYDIKPAPNTYTEARIESADFSQLAPTEYHADLVVLLVDDAPVLGIVVEVQLAQTAATDFRATCARPRA